MLGVIHLYKIQKLNIVLDGKCLIVFVTKIVTV